MGGIAVVDIGAHSTELVCYFGESVQLATTIKICGDHFSRDIAFALHVPLEDGALVKEEFGSAVAEGTAENSVVELPSATMRARNRAKCRASGQSHS